MPPYGPAQQIPDQYRDSLADRRRRSEINDNSEDAMGPSGLERMYHDRLQQDPSFQLPPGYQANQDGSVTTTDRNFIDQHPWLIPLMGAGAGLAGGAILGGAGVGAGAGAGAGGVAAGGGVGGAEVAGGILPSTALGSGMAGTVAGGTGLGAGAYGGAAAGGVLASTAAPAATSGAGTLGTAARIGSAIAPILGNAAHGQQQSEQQGYQNQVTAEQLRLQEPGIRLSNLLRTNAAANGPVVAHWGGPGSGLRGETLHYSGGNNDPLPPNVQSQMPHLVDQRLQEALAPTSGNPALNPPNGNSIWDKILGGAAIGSSILGGFSPRGGGR